jgi:hypothetical protein
VAEAWTTCRPRWWPGIWITIMLILVGLVVVGLVVGSATTLGALLWRYWPLLRG